MLLLLAFFHVVSARFLHVPDEAINEIAYTLQLVDENAAGPNDAIFYYQDHINKGSNAQYRFIPCISKSYQKKPTVLALLHLMEEFEPQIGRREIESPRKLKRIDNFMTEIIKTKVMNVTYQFLKKLNCSETDSMETFKQWLKKLWFTTFPRRKRTVDSSAFEHVFIGELEGKKVKGLHNWIRFAYLESKGKLDYIGFISERQDSVATISFKWSNVTKPVGGMLLGSSPEFDMAIFTLCYLFRPGGKPCRFYYKGCEVTVVSYYIQRNGKNFMSTAYPKAGDICLTPKTHLLHDYRIPQAEADVKKENDTVPIYGNCSMLHKKMQFLRMKIIPVVKHLKNVQMKNYFWFHILWLLFKSTSAEVSKVSDEELINIINDLQSVDVNRAALKDVTFNYQFHVSVGKPPPERFITFISQSYKKKPTVAAFLDLMNTFNPEIGSEEKPSAEQRKKVRTFINRVMQTNVMNHTFVFLKHIAKTMKSFKKWMYNLWFDSYSRKNGPPDSSAFEHVFMGELENQEVHGLHNWIRLAYLESIGALKYSGFVIQRKDSTASIRFKWNGKTKHTGTVLLGSSPELDMAIYTICYIVRPKNQDCKFFYKGCEVKVKAYEIYRHGRRHLSSTFPTPGEVCSLHSNKNNPRRSE
ncbi:Poly(U)-specific endoribonuclease -like protein [Trichinella britovi]|uniref:Poly(U)-specific endoribonuclease-like protein n=1 Tax=Trichinella britovi TaxID=45882 RepID=A0A0V1CER3_TRIBR|nr:Poly(U)-specific endoribonuclease -like protein [Trichinella britovi]